MVTSAVVANLDRMSLGRAWQVVVVWAFITFVGTLSGTQLQAESSS